MSNVLTTTIVSYPFAGFADNPIVIKAKVENFPSDAVFRQVVVTVNNGKYRFPAEVEDGVPMTFDISSAARAEYHAHNLRNLCSLATAGQCESFNAVQLSVKAHAEYILDGTLCSEAETSAVQFYVHPGGLAETYRLTHGLTDADTYLSDSPYLTTKPSSVELVGVGDHILRSQYSDTNHKTSTSLVLAAAEGLVSGRNVYVESNPDRHEFFFLNSLGVFENASAVSLESLSYKSATEEKSIVNTPSFLPKPTLMAVHAAPHGEWKMSSGYVPREWADWWTTEFLAARRHWLRIPATVPGASPSGYFLPVTITPDKDSTTIYDRSKQELSAIAFTVRSAVTGSIL